MPAVGVNAHVLLTGFQTDWPSCLADGLLSLLAVGYLIGVERLRRRGRRWPLLNTVVFECGLFAVFLALYSGLAAYEDDNFSAHVVQHILLMMVAPPLLVLGRPLALLAQSASGSVQVRTISLLGSRPVRVALLLASGIAYYAVMWLYFLTPWYAASVRSSSLLGVTHCLFLLTGLWYWQVLLGVGTSSRLVRVAAILAGMPFEMYLGYLLLRSSSAIGPGTTAASTRAGGEIFWWLTMLLSGVTLALALWQLVFEEEQVALQRDNTEPDSEWTYPSPEPESGQAGISRGLPAPAK